MNTGVLTISKVLFSCLRQHWKVCSLEIFLSLANACSKVFDFFFFMLSYWEWHSSPESSLVLTVENCYVLFMGCVFNQLQVTILVPPDQLF